MSKASFIKELSLALHEQGKVLSVTTPPEATVLLITTIGAIVLPCTHQQT